MTTEAATTLTLYCPACNEDRDFHRDLRTETHRVRGADITADLTTYVCPVCGDTQPDPDHDPMALLYAEYRRRHGLLDPQEIKRIPEQYGLSRESFAQLLGMSPASLYRYEAGSLQDEVHDNLIRACDDPQEMIAIFDRHGSRLSDLQQRRFWDAIAQLPQPIRTPTWTEQWRQPNEYNGNRLFSHHRFAAMVRCICDTTGGVFTAKLFKLLFFADFLAYKQLDRSISGSPYRAIQHGPVPADYGALMQRLVQDDILTSEEVDFGQRSGTKYTSGPKSLPAEDSLTQREIEIIQAVANRFHHMTATEIREAAHHEEAWKQTPQKKLVSYEWAKQLSIEN